MIQGLRQNEVLENLKFADEDLLEAAFEDCRFYRCNFSYAKMLRTSFENCEFHDCDLSLVKCENTAMNQVSFKGCKIIGVDFSRCRDFLFSVGFDRCILDYAGFHQRKMKKTLFSECSMVEVHFNGADLSQSIFRECNLQNAFFAGTNLEGVDFRTAFNFSINPEENRIRKAKFSQAGLAGLLHKYQIIVE